VWKRSALVALALLLPACSSDGPDTSADGAASTSTSTASSPTPGPAVVGTVTIAEAGCTLDLDGPVAAGEIAFEVENATDGLGAANLAELVGGTFRDLERHIREEVRRTEQGQESLGHPDFAVPLFEVVLDAGTTGTMSGALDAGTYALTCAKTSGIVGELRPLAALGPVEVR
jgi:hypothetical protein